MSTSEQPSKHADTEGYQMAAIVVAFGIAFCLACFGVGGCCYMLSSADAMVAKEAKK